MQSSTFSKGFVMHEQLPVARRFFSPYISKTMVLMFLLLFIAGFANAKGMQGTITFSGRDVPVEKVFKAIREQTGFVVVCNESLLKIAKPVSIVVKEAPLKDFLSLAFRNQPFRYMIGKNSIFLFPDSSTPTKKLAELPAVEETRFVPVRGRVTDSAGAPLPGASISIKGKKVNAVADAEGRFGIEAEEGDVLVISIVGYVSREVTVGANKDIVIKLNTDQQKLGEVVITGFQDLRKETFTGSAGKVDKALLQRSGTGDVSRMLQGAVAGVSVENVSATFGSTPKIRIRGSASISANQEPLYVVDGVAITSPANVQPNQLYSGDPAALLGSAIAGLNAADIEDITILKDGAATSLYGTRAANGVISITTKKGKRGRNSVNYSSALTLGMKPDIATFNLMDSKEQMDLAHELYRFGYLSVLNYNSTTGAFTDTYEKLTRRKITEEQANELLNRARSVNTNWFDILFRNNLVQEHNLSFSGGNEKATYYLSGSYLHDDGQAIGYKTNRYTANLRTTLNLTPNLDIDFTTNFSLRDQLAPGTFNSSTTRGEVTRSFELNPFNYAVSTSRAMTPYDENGNYQYYLRDYAPFNILNEINENFNTLKSQELRAILKLNYRIIPGLRYEALLSARKTTADYSHIMTENSNVAAAYRVETPQPIAESNPYLYKDPLDPDALPVTILPEGGIKDRRANYGNFLFMRHALEFRKAWKQHELNVFGGMEVGSDRVDRNYTRAFGYQHYSGSIISPSPLALRRSIEQNEPYYTEGFTQENKTAFFLTANYSFRRKYNIDLAARADGSNMFGRGTRSKYLPNYSAGISWNMDKEDFMAGLVDAGTINFLKLRGSYALRGNAWQNSPALNASFVNINRTNEAYNELAIRINSPELYNLNWEKDYTTSVGIDLGLFNKLSLTAEYYNRKNKDLVSSRDVPYEEGFGTKTINWASMTNSGVDITLGIRDIVRTKDFHWNANILFGYVKNRLTAGQFSPLLTLKTSPQGYGVVGHPLSGLFAYRYAKLDENGQPLFYGAKGQLVDNIQFSSQDDSLISYQGPRDPTITGSFTNTFNYKSFELRIFFTYSMGNKVFRSPIVNRIYQDYQATQRDVAARWRIPGDEQMTDVPGLVSNIQNAYYSSAFIQREFAYNRSDRMVVSANVLRLSEITLSYDLLNKVKPNSSPLLKSARFSLAANNIYFWAHRDLRGVDPQSIITGVSLPNPASFSFRINAQF